MCPDCGKDYASTTTPDGTHKCYARIRITAEDMQASKLDYSTVTVTREQMEAARAETAALLKKLGLR